jgi:hypothetical protein
LPSHFILPIRIKQKDVDIDVFCQTSAYVCCYGKRRSKMIAECCDICEDKEIPKSAEGVVLFESNGLDITAVLEYMHSDCGVIDYRKNSPVVLANTAQYLQVQSLEERLLLDAAEAIRVVENEGAVTSNMYFWDAYAVAKIFNETTNAPDIGMLTYCVVKRPELLCDSRLYKLMEQGVISFDYVCSLNKVAIGLLTDKNAALRKMWLNKTVVFAHVSYGKCIGRVVSVGQCGDHVYVRCSYVSTEDIRVETPFIREVRLLTTPSTEDDELDLEDVCG